MEERTALDKVFITNSSCCKCFYVKLVVNNRENMDEKEITFLELSSVFFFSFLACANWTFGNNCDECACVRLHTEFCNKANGQCHCKPGFTGEACQCVDNGQPCPHCKIMKTIYSKWSIFVIYICVLEICKYIFQVIRIVNGNTTSMGRVEVVTNGVWSTVCDQGWSYNEASVVCNQLGLGR